MSLVPDTPVQYRVAVFLSATLSVIWHFLEEPPNIWFYLDYSGAAIWFFCDMYYAEEKSYIAFLNFIVFITNYYIPHPVWHILSASKSYYTASLIKK